MGPYVAEANCDVDHYLTNCVHRGCTDASFIVLFWSADTCDDAAKGDMPDPRDFRAADDLRTPVSPYRDGQGASARRVAGRTLNKGAGRLGLEVMSLI